MHICESIGCILTILDRSDTVLVMIGDFGKGKTMEFRFEKGVPDGVMSVSVCIIVSHFMLILNVFKSDIYAMYKF